ncbi:peptidoglycan DD-metalloendopeptidase family protein [Erythrobacter arachoides]|uniref:Peptidoglycan DD-metalloendopeptidase family protein n=2 Tax=Aurantiacibacter arachoides TaxID=1850444 RepID=A0A845A1B3_9SPHN|nr:peptidoglycan DD-metalloendopeptidase family protein [Aurantiacibacter arachoides]
MDREESAAIRDDLEYQLEADPNDANEEVRSLEAESVPNTTTRVTTQPTGEAAQLMIPVLGKSATDLTDTFTDDRGGGTRLHEAMDIMAPEGTSVVAAAPGTLERIFLSDAGGNTLYIRSEDRETIYYYAHLAEYAQGLTEGMTIRRGQRLGTVGSTGNADPAAPHLHFAMLRTQARSEWWEPATAVNPFPLLTRR